MALLEPWFFIFKGFNTQERAGPNTNTQWRFLCEFVFLSLRMAVMSTWLPTRSSASYSTKDKDMKLDWYDDTGMLMMTNIRLPCHSWLKSTNARSFRFGWCWRQRMNWFRTPLKPGNRS